MTAPPPINGVNEIVRLATVLMLRTVCSARSEAAANAETGDDVLYEKVQIDQALDLVNDLYRIIGGIVGSQDPMRELEHHPMMDIRLSHPDPMDERTVKDIQDALRRSFVNLLQSLHTDPKQPLGGLAERAEQMRSVAVLNEDIRQFIPVLTAHLPDGLSLHARLFKIFNATMLTLEESRKDGFVGIDFLESYQPEIVVFILFALRCFGIARAMINRAQSAPSQMVGFLFYDAETVSVYTDEVVRSMMPLMYKYVDRYYSSARPTRRRRQRAR